MAYWLPKPNIIYNIEIEVEMVLYLLCLKTKHFTSSSSFSPHLNMEHHTKHKKEHKFPCQIFIYQHTTEEKKENLEMKWTLLQLEATFHLCMFCNMLLVIGIHVPNKTTTIKVMLSITPFYEMPTEHGMKKSPQNKHESSVSHQHTHTHTDQFVQFILELLEISSQDFLS